VEYVNHFSITLPTESGSMTLDMNWNETTERREKLCEEGHMRSEILKASNFFHLCMQKDNEVELLLKSR